VEQMGGSLDYATRLLLWWDRISSSPDASSPGPPEHAERR